MLEDDSVQLSTIKTSKFYNSFADNIDKWEKSLNAVSETVELILTVQKKWMYLESIFMASEDVCRQLPQESAIFTQVPFPFCFFSLKVLVRRVSFCLCVALVMIAIRRSRGCLSQIHIGVHSLC